MDSYDLKLWFLDKSYGSDQCSAPPRLYGKIFNSIHFDRYRYPIDRIFLAG